jgi:hypothetical protein
MPPCVNLEIAYREYLAILGLHIDLPSNFSCMICYGARHPPVRPARQSILCAKVLYEAVDGMDNLDFGQQPTVRIGKRISGL